MGYPRPGTGKPTIYPNLGQIWLFFLLPLTMAETSSPNTGDQLQGYTFAYGSNQNHLVLPTIYSCPEPITVSGITPTNNGGPDAIAPYTMIAFVHEQLIDGANQTYERMYARTIDLGNIGSTAGFQAPWMEGTQFIGCLWSSNGVSGGCQDLMTVVSHGNITESAYAAPNSECRTENVMGSWVTDPGKTLDVEVQGRTGTIATNAWPSSCSDLKFTPKNGTAPYHLVIAPAFHPPINITLNGVDESMNYTIRLTHGQAFMAGIFDSAGNSWAIGPLHAGHSTDLECLARPVGSGSVSKSFGIGALAGGVVGAFVAGAIGAFLLAWFYLRKKGFRHRGESTELLSDPYANPRPVSCRADSEFSSKYQQPTTGGYSDLTPPMGFDTPSTLYDPVIPRQTVAYPLPPGAHSTRPFPRPPDDNVYPTPFEHGRSTSSEDFNPAWRETGMSNRTRSPENQRDSIGSTHPRSGSGTAGGRGKGGLRAAGGPSGSVRSPSFHETDEEGEYDTQGRRTRNVYVVHSDGGGGDLHIRLPQGEANVIELPPTYRPDPRPTTTTTSPPTAQLIPQSPPPASIYSTRSLPDPGQRPTDQIQSPVASGVEEYSGLTNEEIRARAEAALAEKGRPVSLGPGPRPRGE